MADAVDRRLDSRRRNYETAGCGKDCSETRRNPQQHRSQEYDRHDGVPSLLGPRNHDYRYRRQEVSIGTPGLWNSL
jgi:hypothetical protein